MITFCSTHEMAMTKAAQERAWAAFLSGGSGHSERASTLCYILRRCEQEGRGYILTARPGQGYHVKPA